MWKEPKRHYYDEDGHRFVHEPEDWAGEPCTRHREYVTCWYCIIILHILGEVFRRGERDDDGTEPHY